MEALNKENLEALYGELLGDGHLRFNKKGEDGLPKPNTNAQFAITLKSKEYVYYLWKTIYKDICSNVEPHPWPNPKTGKVVKQYHFASRALPFLSDIHNKWYVLKNFCTTARNRDNTTIRRVRVKFVKIVPLDIGEQLTEISLAHWIMGDGASLNNSIVLCTDSFTIQDVVKLMNVCPRSKLNMILIVQSNIEKSIKLEYIF